MTRGSAVDRSTGEGGREGGREPALLLPVGLIVAALVALVVVPLIVQYRTDRVDEHRSEVAQPARDLVNTVHLSLARGMGALRGFIITGDEVFLDRYEAALEEEREAYSELAPMMTELSPEVRDAFAELQSRSADWHGRIFEAEILRRQLVPQDFLDRLPSEEVRYEATLESARRLRQRLVEEEERSRRQLEREENIGLAVTSLLALLAFGAAIGALRLGRRLRRFAAEAEWRRDEMERAIEGRSRLIRGITHDLKNPLGAARGQIQLVLDGVVDEPERRRDSLQRSERSIDVALGIIHDLLQLSRAEGGALEIVPEPTDVPALVEEVVEDQRDEAMRAGLSFEVEAQEDAPTVRTDGRRVREIVRNLISNAVKYTPEGGTVTVRTRARGGPGSPKRSKQEPGRVLVDVRDTGPGIPPEEREQIFREFARLGPGEGDAEGTGLGLAISRQVARLLGGDIEVESEVGRGSTFTFWLPVDPSD